jgi:hypothetical protein
MLGKILHQWSLSLLLALGCGGYGLMEAIAPQPVVAYPQNVEVYLSRQGGETYDNLLERSSIIARAATQRIFDTDVLVSEVAVTILADNQGLIAPLLTLNVTRDQWWQRPDPRAWINYYDGVAVLLKFSGEE